MRVVRLGGGSSGGREHGLGGQLSCLVDHRHTLLRRLGNAVPSTAVGAGAVAGNALHAVAKEDHAVAERREVVLDRKPLHLSATRTK